MPFFKAALRRTLTAGFDAMVDQGCSVALVAMVSCGIYAGLHRARINEEFEGLVDDILAESALDGFAPRGAYFRQVIIPKLD